MESSPTHVAADRVTPVASEPWRSLYPYRGSRLAIGPWSYHYVDSDVEYPQSVPAAETDDDSRPVILCVHGNPTWSFYWRRVIERFHTTHRVIAVDHIGCGLSDQPSRRDFDYSLVNHRDHLLTLIDRLDLRRIVLLAHDWGGAIGLSAVVERVDRLAGVVLLNTAAFPPPFIPWRIAVCRTPLVGTAAIRGLNLFAAAAISMAMAEQKLPADVASGLLFPYRDWRSRVAIDSFVRDIPLTRRHPTYAVLRRLESDLSRLATVPKSLVWGMKDWCFRPECLDRLLSHWPDATVQRLEQTGHYVIEDAPEATLVAIAELLGRVDRAADR